MVNASPLATAGAAVVLPPVAPVPLSPASGRQVVVSPRRARSPKRGMGASLIGNLAYQLAADERRSRASGALLRSLDERLARATMAFKLPAVNSKLSNCHGASAGAMGKPEVMSTHPTPVTIPLLSGLLGNDDAASIEKDSGRQLRRALTTKEASLFGQDSLKDSYTTYIRTLHDSGKFAFGIEDLVTFLGTAGVLDDWLTADKVRLYFAGASDGGQMFEYGVEEPMASNRIGWPHFSVFLRFAADMKGLKFFEIEQLILNHLRTSSDQSSSLEWRLQVVFEAFGKSKPGRITSLEFVNLLRRTHIISLEGGDFTVGDAILLFKRFRPNGADFDGFVELLDEAGQKLGCPMKRKIADAIETLENDEFVVVRTRLNLKEAASANGMLDLSKLISDDGDDGISELTFPEFRVLCRERLGVKAKDWDLRLLFRKVDADGSGTLDIDELVKFIAEGVVKDESAVA